MSIEIANEYSFGIIPLKIEDNWWNVLVIKHKKGHWAFPKGHAVKGENPVNTAERELKEETGFNTGHYIPICPVMENYRYHRDNMTIDKTVTYFLSEVYSYSNPHISEDEIEKILWVPLDAAHSYLTFNEAKLVCAEVKRLLDTLDETRIKMKG
jgi:bis(5'-nucleosidyl)-tetraphosphatase